MTRRLCDEHARKLAEALTEIVRGCLRPEEVADCFREFQTALQEGLADYLRAETAQQARARLDPDEGNR